MDSFIFFYQFEVENQIKYPYLKYYHYYSDIYQN